MLHSNPRVHGIENLSPVGMELSNKMSKGESVAYDEPNLDELRLRQIVRETSGIVSLQIAPMPEIINEACPMVCLAAGKLSLPVYICARAG